jgi:hypothetical protein
MSESRSREVHYFDLNYGKGPSWYRGYFPFSWDHHITGEAPPFYLFHPKVPERVRGDLDARTRNRSANHGNSASRLALRWVSSSK